MGTGERMPDHCEADEILGLAHPWAQLLLRHPLGRGHTIQRRQPVPDRIVRSPGQRQGQQRTVRRRHERRNGRAAHRFGIDGSRQQERVQRRQMRAHLIGILQLVLDFTRILSLQLARHLGQSITRPQKRGQSVQNVEIADIVITNPERSLPR